MKKKLVFLLILICLLFFVSTYFLDIFSTTSDGQKDSEKDEINMSQKPIKNNSSMDEGYESNNPVTVTTVKNDFIMEFIDSKTGSMLSGEIYDSQYKPVGAFFVGRFASYLPPGNFQNGDYIFNTKSGDRVLSHMFHVEHLDIINRKKTIRVPNNLDDMWYFAVVDKQNFLVDGGLSMGDRSFQKINGYFLTNMEDTTPEKLIFRTMENQQMNRYEFDFLNSYLESNSNLILLRIDSENATQYMDGGRPVRIPGESIQ